MSDGKALTARFLEACGMEKSHVGPTRDGRYFYRLPKPGQLGTSGWKAYGDLTQPGHLETVIGMVRERWPEADIRFYTHGEFPLKWSIKLPAVDPDVPFFFEGVDPKNAAKALMRAAIRAAGKEVHE